MKGSINFHSINTTAKLLNLPPDQQSTTKPGGILLCRNVELAWTVGTEKNEKIRQEEILCNVT